MTILWAQDPHNDNEQDIQMSSKNNKESAYNLDFDLLTISY